MSDGDDVVEVDGACGHVIEDRRVAVLSGFVWCPVCDGRVATR